MAVSDGDKSATLWLFTAKMNRYTIAVTDDPDGVHRVADAGREIGAVATVNGGYFHPDRTPLGLVVVNGKTLHPLEKAPLLSGVVFSAGPRVSLLRVGETRPRNPTMALQAGPFFLEGEYFDSRVDGPLIRGVRGLDETRSAVRTFIFTWGSEKFGVGLCRAATLADTARILANGYVMPGDRVLNLDGGTSSGLWVSQPGDKEFSSPEWKRVRNYLSIVPRQPGP